MARLERFPLSVSRLTPAHQSVTLLMMMWLILHSQLPSVQSAPSPLSRGLCKELMALQRNIRGAPAVLYYVEGKGCHDDVAVGAFMCLRPYKVYWSV